MSTERTSVGLCPPGRSCGCGDRWRHGRGDAGESDSLTLPHQVLRPTSSGSCWSQWSARPANGAASTPLTCAASWTNAHIAQTGCQWRYLLESFGPCTRVWSQFRAPPGSRGPQDRQQPQPPARGRGCMAPPWPPRGTQHVARNIMRDRWSRPDPPRKPAVLINAPLDSRSLHLSFLPARGCGLPAVPGTSRRRRRRSCLGWCIWSQPCRRWFARKWGRST